MEVKYYVDTQKSLQDILQLHCVHTIVFDNINVLNFKDVLPTLGFASVNAFKYKKGAFYEESFIFKENCMPHVNILIIKGSVYAIKTIQPVFKCKDCGSYYKAIHNCAIRRQDFYFHYVNHCSSNWWQEINFFPIGSCEETKRLYITYDLETYTWHGKYGKQLVPFLIVLAFTGNTDLVNKSSTIAKKLKWSSWNSRTNVFFYINSQPKAIGQKFKKLRKEIQLCFISKIYETFLQENNFFDKICKKNKLSHYSEVTFDMLSKFKVLGEPQFIEIYVVGHNINGFDEILLAAQVLENKLTVPMCFKIQRNFLPRNGKLLFNDIMFCLPNPLFEKRTNFTFWEEGVSHATDYKYQYVKCMVRDTYALTHSSLRHAAGAYNLDVNKGCCPYQAVNEFFMKGSYDVDCDGFPALRYWQNAEEYAANKKTWKEKNSENNYDIVKETLDYCALDVIVTYQLVDKLLKSYNEFIRYQVGLDNCNFNILQRPTISSNSHAIFKQILYSTEKPKKQTLGHTLMAPSHEMYDYVRLSIRGGRCYPTFIGIFTKPIYVFDICGMYASALTHPLPSGMPLSPKQKQAALIKWQQVLNIKNKIDYFNYNLLPAIFTIDADPPQEIYLDVLPPFCSKKGGRLCWTNEPLRGEVCTSVDAITLHNRGWKVTILKNEHSTVFPEWKCLAKKYVELNIVAKEKADIEKNQTMRSIAKLLSNALYGSFATKLDNKTVIFADELHEKQKFIRNGTLNIESTCIIETDNFSAEILPKFSVTYSVDDASQKNADCDFSDSEEDMPIYSSTNHAHSNTTTFQPITFLEADDDEMCLYTLEKSSNIVENKRYASHIASFVLAWTRAFTSEWAQFLFEDDYGTPIEQRTAKAIYGDTDSLFLTEEGKFLLETKGKKRLKKNNGKLVFDECNPDLTWLVECETICKQCGADAFSSETVFLAPKLYALKNTVCTKCCYVGDGKLRAKGHAKEELSYNLLVACYLSDYQRSDDTFTTSRQSLKRTLVNAIGNYQPFSITETKLVRALRPWKDKTLTEVDQHYLMPYCTRNPNPRNTETCMVTLE